jgi:hypothetical protein
VRLGTTTGWSSVSHTPRHDGFGREVRDAMVARADHLASEGLARRQGQRITLQRNLLARLRQRELDAAGAKLSGDTGLPNTPAAAGETVAGVYRQRLTLASGRFAVIDDGLGFQLVPWPLLLEKQLGRHVAGVAKEGGGIEWGPKVVTHVLGTFRYLCVRAGH